jgi:two-component system, OmpR family, KDP operon response regulator KdpE
MVSERHLVANCELRVIFLLRQALTGEGYQVIVASKGEQVVKVVAKEQPSLVIMGVILAGEVDGFEAVRHIRGFTDIPIILLSKCDSTEDALHRYTLGADDYIVNPFDPKILLARIRVIIKRSRNWIKTPGEIVCSDLVIDLIARRVTRKGTEVYLTDTEYNLLLMLARNRNRVLMHDQLLVEVWGKEFRNEVGHLRSYIHILRRKLEDDPLQSRLIISRPGIGYMLITAQNKDSGE